MGQGEDGSQPFGEGHVGGEGLIDVVGTAECGMMMREGAQGGFEGQE